MVLEPQGDVWVNPVAGKHFRKTRGNKEEDDLCGGLPKSTCTARRCFSAYVLWMVVQKHLLHIQSAQFIHLFIKHFLGIYIASVLFRCWRYKSGWNTVPGLKYLLWVPKLLGNGAKRWRERKKLWVLKLLSFCIFLTDVARIIYTYFGEVEGISNLDKWKVTGMIRSMLT